MQTEQDLLGHDPATSGVIDTTGSVQTDEALDQGSKEGKLSSEDFIELTRISRKKDDIERHIANLQNWPEWDPFQNVSSYIASLKTLQSNRETLETIRNSLQDRQEKCNRLERDVQQFNLEEMKRLRMVAKAVSKRHLSGPDTDLLELALETVYALDKLLRLLRERRTEHDLTELRLQWEATVCSSWEDVAVLRRDIDSFELKCKAVLTSRAGYDELPSREAVSKPSKQASDVNPDSPREANQKRLPSSTLSSSKLATESVKLEASRLVLRARSFNTDKVRPAGRLLDLLIDQRQVPEKLIDEQEKLEDALPQPAAIEARSSEVAFGLREVAEAIPGTQRIVATPTRDPSVIDDSPALVQRVDVGSGHPATSNQDVKPPCAGQTSSRSIQLGSRSRKNSGSSTFSTPSRIPSNRYRSNPHDVLDIAIGRIVNRMPISVSIKSAEVSLYDRPSTAKDLSGQYWIGDPEPRLCFCRILPSNMVMVRVGGGWQELSGFLTQHYSHLNMRGVQTDSVLANGTPARPASSLTWLRSASGPVLSPHLRSKSSVGTLRSHETTRQSTSQQPLRIVTMPTVRRDFGSVPDSRIIPNNLSEQTVAEHRDRSFSTPPKTSELATSGSASSIITHSSSPGM